MADPSLQRQDPQPYASALCGSSGLAGLAIGMAATVVLDTAILPPLCKHKPAVPASGGLRIERAMQFCDLERGLPDEVAQFGRLEDLDLTG